MKTDITFPTLHYATSLTQDPRENQEHADHCAGDDDLRRQNNGAQITFRHVYQCLVEIRASDVVKVQNL